MRIDKASPELLEKCYRSLDARTRRIGAPVFIRYVDLGTHVVRLINYSETFTPHVERQLSWSLKDEAPSYDATLIIWQEQSIDDVALTFLGHHNPNQYRKLRIQRAAGGKPKVPEMVFYDEAIQRNTAFMEVNAGKGLVTAWNPGTNTYYYGVKDLTPEEFIKRGHIFVQIFFKVAKSPTSSLVHGAAVGLDGKGILFCAMGYRGKSTLTVNALLDGFDYVSDDYLILGKQDDILRAWPIYSIVALSPQAYQAMYHRLKAKFVSNNARKDKYIFNIADYHNRFSPAYPIKLCMFPHITDCREPSIVPGDKERSIEELVFSSLGNTGNMKDAVSIGRLYSFVEKLPFYRFNLSPNIDKNTRYLREFLERFD